MPSACRLKTLAMQHGIHPVIWTLANIENMKRQLKTMGISYDWDRELATCKPDYYKFTQWMFLKLYQHGLAYKKKSAVNWCPSCQTVLANEQVVDNSRERCEAAVERSSWSNGSSKSLIMHSASWMIWNSRRAGRKKVKTMQRNRIGRSEGCQFDMQIAGSDERISVFDHPSGYCFWGHLHGFGTRAPPWWKNWRKTPPRPQR